MSRTVNSLITYHRTENNHVTETKHQPSMMLAGAGSNRWIDGSRPVAVAIQHYTILKD